MISKTKNMTSLAIGFILKGTRYDYRILALIGGNALRTTTVFQAEVISEAMIKIVSTSHPEDMESMRCEVGVYGYPNVATADCFRRLYEVLDNRTMVFEWLDTTLAEVPFQPTPDCYALILAVLRAALRSCVHLESHRRVNADIQPTNILISNLNTDRLIVKIGDLGHVLQTHRTTNTQPLLTRAPEVFLNNPCTPASHVWSIGATLLYWLNPTIIGPEDGFTLPVNEAWCMAKLKRLFPQWQIPVPEEEEAVMGPMLRYRFQMARYLAQNEDLASRMPLRRELDRMRLPFALIELLCLMLEVWPQCRPSARGVLGSAELSFWEDFVRE
ncbi:kinase-like protein [Aspergillus ibericus CBS 121593]|uniref:Kinase-like protein n=1 Tax=Aspergillus ibericus CBS 121593 TaxID=1448316 RepID=A0A395GNP3_9EURO|nr:kinase-like protein [Aspergillus ibericus CBS 121593]RAK96467.1 kinase-like protein [Aspergillus ibericus CBS 121593]